MRNSGAVKLFTVQGGKEEKFMVAGWRPNDPVPLNDSRYLRLAISLQLIDTPQGPRLKSIDSSFQYQLDKEGDRWIFRYDYLRHSADHPPAHFQIRANLSENSVLTQQRQTLERIHFPTSRVSLEAIIRLLVDEFGINCNEPPDVGDPYSPRAKGCFLTWLMSP